jgi:hypothetical protein
VEIVMQIVDDLSVDDFVNLARTSRAMYETLGPSAQKLSKLKRAVDLVLDVKLHRLDQLTPQQRKEISNAIADQRPIPRHLDAEILANLNEFVRNLESMPQEEAAKHTWTGRRAAEFGFTQASVPFPLEKVGTAHEVRAYFSKPSST